MDAVTSQRLKDCLRKVEPFSDTVQAVLKQLGEEPLNINKVCRTLELDPILASTILRLANSPFYGFARKISSVKDAAVLLGVHTLRQVVISFSMVSAFPMRGGHTIDRQALWRHSVGVAVGAKLLAEQVGNNPDEAFIAGILHDIGQFIMDQCLAEEYGGVVVYRHEHLCSLVEAEQALFGVDHATVGAAAIRMWKLPEPLSQSALAHAFPRVDQNPSPLNDLVHLANVIALGLWADGAEEADMEELSPAAMERLGLSWKQLDGLIPKIDSMSQEVIGRLLH
ncbi:HDOD domain-containing protein [Motiliproteus sediminis]|uniref:HDOD domain-containing protein n=1 Tax=Motiliproteus sediminis TaxID=1468178 RepID=UPI001AEF5A7B|nr:HDOD domain-containing protein [Motiliproteus sediminis]